MTYISWSSDFALYLEDFDIWTLHFGIMSQYDSMFDLKINVGHCDLYFMVQWFCLISWRFWYMNTTLWDYESVWLDVWPKNKCRSLWPIFHGPVILPYILKTVWCVNTIIWDYESVWPEVWPEINVGHCDLYFMVQWFCLISCRLFDISTPYFGILSQYDLIFDLKIKCRSLWPIYMAQWFCLISWRLFDIWTPYFGIMSQYDLMFDLKINVGHCDLYFMVQWFCLISWRLLDIWTPYFGVMSQYDPMFDLKINIGHCDLYFMVQWFCLISWILFDIWPPYFGIMSQYDLKINVGHWPIFHGPVILPYILKTIWYMNTYFGIMSQCDPMFDLKINVGHYDLYFMVQWFCLISWRLFDVWTLLFGIMSRYDPKFDLKINVGHCDLYFIVHWFCLISWRLFDISTPYFGIMSQYDLMFDLRIKVGHCDLYFMVQWFCLISWRLFDIWTPYTVLWDYESVWPDVWPENKNRSLWPIFHCPLILAYIFVFDGWMSYFWKISQCNTVQWFVFFKFLLRKTF